MNVLAACWPTPDRLDFAASVSVCGGISMCDGDGNWLCVKCSSTAIPSSAAESKILVMVDKVRDARMVTPQIVECNSPES